MATVLPIPPTGTPLFDQNFQINPIWQNYFLSLQNIGGTFAPVDARYWTSKSNSTLTDEQDIGLLATGYLTITTAIGVATPSTVTTIPAADVSGQLALANGGTGADLSGTGGASEVLRQSTLSGPVTVSKLTTNDITNLAASTYTPTLTGVANVAASTPYQCQYLRVGSSVTVSGKVDIDPTSATTLTQLGISLPIASDFSAIENCGGTASAPAVAGYVAAILADATNNRAELDFTTAADVANRSWSFSFTYLVI